MALYDRGTDDCADKAIKRADEEMYKNKRIMKQGDL